MEKLYEIKIGDSKSVISTKEVTSQELIIGNKTYIVPTDVIEFIAELAGEIKTQQERRIADDKQIDAKIRSRVDRIIKALASRGMLSKDLDEEYPLPNGWDADCGRWTFLDEAREVAREGMMRSNLDLVAEIGNPLKI